MALCPRRDHRCHGQAGRRSVPHPPLRDPGQLRRRWRIGVGPAGDHDHRRARRALMKATVAAIPVHPATPCGTTPPGAGGPPAQRRGACACPTPATGRHPAGRQERRSLRSHRIPPDAIRAQPNQPHKYSHGRTGSCSKSPGLASIGNPDCRQPPLHEDPCRAGCASEMRSGRQWRPITSGLKRAMGPGSWRTGASRLRLARRAEL